MSRFRMYSCCKFYISLNFKSSLVKAYLNDNNSEDEIRYIEEKKPLGTTGALYLLKNKIRTTFFLINCDILIEADYGDILRYHKKSGNQITLVTAMKNYTIPYGICDIHKGGKLKRITEKPEYDLLVNTGMYILEPEIIKDIPPNTFFHMTDLVNAYLKRGLKIGAYPISGKAWLDIGQIDGLVSTLDCFGINIKKDESQLARLSENLNR